jgi:beta-glucanase (GH16 family)
LAQRVAGVLCAVALAGATALASQARAAAVPSSPVSAATLVFSDDFEGSAGSPPNPAYWDYDTGRWGAGVGEQQYYTNRTDNARLDGNGILDIVARPETYAGAGYTSARLQTRGKASFQPPIRIAARMQIPAGTGLIAQFWTLGTDLFTRGWPQCGEIDIVEVKGDSPHDAQFHTHSASLTGSDYSVGDTWTSPASLAEGFHDYRVDWYDTTIEFYVDGALRFTVHRANLPSVAWSFSTPHYLTLNTAVGNRWIGYPDSTTPWPAVLRVDWVKAWRLG